jgi:hypothetical protein
MKIGDRDDSSRSIKKRPKETPLRAREPGAGSPPERLRESSGNRPADRIGVPKRGTGSDLDLDADSVSSNPVAARALTRRQADTAATLTGGGDTDFDTLAAEETKGPDESGESDEASPGLRTTSADAAERAALAAISPRNVNRSNTETYEENGVTYTKETRQGARGSEISTTTYEIDGVEYTETVSQGNGSTNIRVEAVNGDHTEISETRTQSVPGELEDYLPEGYVDGIDFDRDAARGATHQTVETTTVIDNSQNPPVRTVTSDSTTYSQEVVSGLPGEITESPDGGQSIQIHHGTNSAPYNTTTYENVQFDPKASGQTISYTEATRLDAEGNPQSSTTLSSESRLVGQGEDGHEVVISSRSDNIVDGQGRNTLVLTNQSLGTIPADPQAISDIYQHNLRLNDDGLLERVQEAEGPWLDLRETTVYADEGPPTGTTTTEFGELDQEGDGRSLTVVRDGVTESHTYRLVSDGGDRIQTQTQVPGTDYNAVTDLQYGADGTFTSSSQTTLEGETIASSSASRELAYPAGQLLPTQPPEGFSPELWEQFRAESPRGPVYLDQIESTSQDENGVESSSQSRSYGSNSAQVGTVENDGPEGAGQGQFFTADGPPPKAMVMGPDGTLAEVSPEGDVLINGDRASQAANLGVQLASGRQALRELLGELEGIDVLPNRLSRALGPIGTVVGAADLIRAGNASERVSAAGGVLGGVGSSLELLGTAGRVGRLAKGAGIAGGVLTGGVGVYELFQGEYAKGTADLVAGGATVAALLILGTNPVGAAILGTVAVGASIVRILLDDQEERPEQPEWAF